MPPGTAARPRVAATVLDVTAAVPVPFGDAPPAAAPIAPAAGLSGRDGGAGRAGVFGRGDGVGITWGFARTAERGLAAPT